MRMLPSQLLQVNSSAERAIFGLLRKLDLGSGAIALHSLNLPRHQYKQWSEADFIVICAHGLLLLEVKGGRVACVDGIWEFENRYGEVTKKSESPAAQAKSAFFALRDNYLNPRFSTLLRNIPMGWGVIFKDIDRLVTKGQSILPEQPDEVTAYRMDCVGHNSLGAFLERSLSYWGFRTSRTGQLVPSIINEIANHLRPTFEQVPPLANRLDEFGQGLASFTEEQYARLDDIQENDRIIVRGGAGTGKTFLAMASARYDRAQGREVLITTRSRHLVHDLQNASPPVGVDIVAYDDLEDMLAKRGRPWTSIIIDEAQDLCQAEAVNLFERAVDGGLGRGRWRWFGDPNRQVSESHPVDEDVLSYFGEMAVKCRLHHNVRNAPKIVEAIGLYAGADIGSPAPMGQGSDVTFHECASDGVEPAIVSILRSWVSGQGAAKRSDVAVLVPHHKSVGPIVSALVTAGIRAEPLVARLGGKVRDAVVVAQIEDFKGLERPLICVAGLGENSTAESIRGLVYRSFSRANHTLALVYTAIEAEELAKVAVSLAVE